MEAANVLCEKKEQIVLNNFFEDLKTLLQDSDAIEEKEKVQNSLKKMTDTTTYIILGNAGVGKTSLLNAVFQGMTSFSDALQGEMCEYRWGEQELVTPLVDGKQKKFVTSEDMRGISVIDTRGIDSILPDTKERMKSQVEKCSAVFVVFDADNIRSPKLWDIIEGCPEKNMIFFLTKCDLIPQEELKDNMEKIRKYMNESGISAPVFPISIVGEAQTQGVVPLNEVRIHIRENVIGKNPMLNKQMENVEEMKKVLVQVKDSFALRKQQYQSDSEILQKINRSLDTYMVNHQKTLDKFLEVIKQEINKDIDSYEQEIISKLDPYKIKERFRNKNDFMDYLNMVNENYRNMMTESVNHKAIETIKNCLHGLEIVFQESVGYFNTRENILALNDRFYGSLSTSRKKMSDETKELVLSSGQLYHTLSEASETLFMQIWNEREKYDAKIRNRKLISSAGGVTGAGAGGVAGGIAIKAAAVGAKVAAGKAVTLGIIGGGAIFVIGAIVGVVVINAIAKSLYDPKAADKMEENVQKCIEQFKSEVNNTRINMIEQISSQITEIFKTELASVDSCFTDFRMSVNIDEKKIPLLEQHLLEAEDLLMRLENI